MKNFFSIFTERRIAVTFFLGLSSALPLALSSWTLQAWYTMSGVSLKEIGFVGLAAAPYTFKFLWAPLMDRWVPPLLGRRRGWMLICQFLLCLAIGSMVLFTPDTYPKVLFLIACLVAFFSASQDIALDAYTTDVLPEKQRALGAAMKVNGYRIGMLVSGGLALVIADHFGWKIAYLTMAALMGVGVIATLLGPNPEEKEAPPKRMWDCTVLPFMDFLRRPQSIWILLLIVFYKFGDAYGGALCQTFMLREIHMTLTEVGTLAKLSGFFGTITGTLIGAILIQRWGWFKSLLVFGILQAISNLSYMTLLLTGPNYLVAGSSFFVENLCGGMGTVAFLGLIMGLCNARFTAFQFSLLSSLSMIGRVFVSPLAGYIAEDYGWISYFMSSLVLSAPGLILLLLLKNGITNMTETQAKNRANATVVPANTEAPTTSATAVPSTS